MTTATNPAKSGGRLLRHLRARPRLWISVSLGAITAWLLPGAVAQHWITRGLIGWNAGAVLYLALVLTMMLRASPEAMRWRARVQDEGRFAILVAVCIASVAVLLAIGVQLSEARDMHGALKFAHIALAGLTVLTSWLFVQVMFALHYAHEYQLPCHGKDHAFEFPGQEEPDYLDFLYMACIIGTSAQTADVSFTSRSGRRIGLLHSVLSFFFNTALVALAINVGAGLI